jgi:hypothetical protein
MLLTGWTDAIEIPSWFKILYTGRPPNSVGIAFLAKSVCERLRGHEQLADAA